MTVSDTQERKHPYTKEEYGRSFSSHLYCICMLIFDRYRKCKVAIA